MGQIYSLPCPKCPTKVVFENAPGLLRVTCRACGTVVYERNPNPNVRALAPVPAGAEKVANPPPRTRANPASNAPPDDVIGKRDVVWKDGEQDVARRLLDW
jgi:hypothetical protein